MFNNFFYDNNSDDKVGTNNFICQGAVAYTKNKKTEVEIKN
jgi:hypothetical protein